MDEARSTGAAMETGPSEADRQAPGVDAAGAAEGTSAAGRRTCILVLGMHRSGTSALTRALSLLGAALPKALMPPAQDNEVGFWEPIQLVALNERMLAEAGSRWDDWRPFELGDPARAEHYRGEIARILAEEYGDAPLFVLKDPRISRFVPLYAEALAGMGIEPRYVLTLRNPLDVIASLGRRDGHTFGFAALLWLRHALEAERATRGAARVFVAYEAVLADWRREIDRIGEALALRWPRSVEEAAGEIDRHISPDHRHHDEAEDAIVADPRLPTWVKDAYASLRELVSAPYKKRALAGLNRVGAEFDAATHFFGPAFFHEIDARERFLTGRLDNLACQHAKEVARLSSDLEQKKAEATFYKAQIEAAIPRRLSRWVKTLVSGQRSSR